MRVRSRARRAPRILWALPAALLALTACGGGAAEVSPEEEAASPGWSQTVAAAEQEGTVVVYTPYLQNQQDALQAAFAERYPAISVQMVRQLSGVEAKLDAEKQTGAAGADVVVTNDPGLAARYAASGDLLPLGGPAAEAWSGNPHLAGDTAFTSTFNTLGIAWNTGQVDAAVTGYADLLRPELKGRIGLVDMTGTPAIVDFYRFLEETQGPDFLTRLAAQEPRFYPSTVPLQQAVVAGEVSVAGYVVPAVREEADAGAPVGFVLPTPAWAAPFDAFGVGWAKHPNAAKVVLDFMMSPEGQTALGIDGTSALAGVTTLAPLDGVRLSEVGSIDQGEAAEFAGRWKAVFGR
jgi:iron(III) transport system substrate-binding protein